MIDQPSQPPPTIGAAPFYTSQVFISLVITVLTQLFAVAPKLFTAIGWTSTDIISSNVQAIFQVIALIAGAYAAKSRQQSKLQPLTLTPGSAELHPATIAAVKAGTRLTS